MKTLILSILLAIGAASAALADDHEDYYRYHHDNDYRYHHRWEHEHYGHHYGEHRHWENGRWIIVVPN